MYQGGKVTERLMAIVGGASSRSPPPTNKPDQIRNMTGKQGEAPVDERMRNLFPGTEEEQNVRREGALGQREITDRPENLDIIHRVKAAVTRFFESISRFFSESYRLLRDKAIGLLPGRIAAWLDPRRKVVHALLEIPAEQREEVIRFVLSFDSSGMDQSSKDALIKTVTDFSNDDDKLAKEFFPLITPASSLYAPSSRSRLSVSGDDFIRLFLDPHSEDGSCVATRARTHFPPETGLQTTKSRWLFLERMAELDNTARSFIIANADPLFSSAMGNQTMEAITVETVFTAFENPLRWLCSVCDGKYPPRRDRRTSFEAAESLIGCAVRRLFTPEMHVEERAIILGEAANEALAKYFLGPGKMVFIEAVAALPAEKRKEVITSALPLLKTGMDSFEKGKIVQVVAAIPPGEQQDVAARASPLISEELNGLAASEIVQEVAAVAAEERADVITLVSPLFTQEIDNRGRAVIIKMVHDVPAREREEFVALVRQLISPQMDVHEKINQFRMVAERPAAERAEFVRRRLALQYAPHRLRPPQAEGVDVHTGNRDPRTKKAIELLRKRQARLSFDEVDRATNEFIEYLNNSSVAPDKKRRAQDALLKPRGSSEGFGALIPPDLPDEFSVQGLLTSGKELIGRLWIFASNLTEQEQTLAKESMITALSESSDQNGERVCNQGKTQRLIVAVLQGRLDGVNIDEIPVQVSGAQALPMFFNVKARQDIDNLEDLLEAAAKFCNENPAVNREDFIRQIHDFAVQQGMERKP